MEIIKTYVVPVLNRSVFDQHLFQKLHFTKGGLYFLDSGRAMLRISIEEAEELINAKF